jgi:hypothetical protein
MRITLQVFYKNIYDQLPSISPRSQSGSGSGSGTIAAIDAIFTNREEELTDLRKYLFKFKYLFILAKSEIR